jgi:RHS repeat-associated protein
MIDGTGTNTYSCNAVNGALGAGQLASLDGPLSNDVISYGYDELGRVKSRAINAVTNAVTYDALGRVTVVNNALGVFTNTYVNTTARLSAIAYPNGQTANFTYYGNTQDQRLSEIKHLSSTNGVISKFNYGYDVVGQITNWTQQVDAQNPKAYALGYDAADQLISAVLRDTVTTDILKRYVYSYDAAGNRLSEQIDTNVTTSSHNNLNQLTSQTGTGPVRFKGSVSEPATVTITNTGPAVAATVASNGTFEASVPLSQGTNTVSVIAQDYSSNKATNRYQVVVGAGADRVLTYDLNGNLIAISNSQFVITHEWDAANRLVAIERTSTNRTEFAYDGVSRRTKITEIDGGVTNAVRLLWCGAELCEERDSAGSTVNKHYFSQGMKQGTNSYFYSRDHLGSVREMTDANGATRARYDYDPYGRRSKVSGDLDADFGFTGHYLHAPSGLHLPKYRAYDAELGRWTGRDPIGESCSLLPQYLGRL